MSRNPTLRLADYRPPSFTTDKVDLNFDIHEDHTIATSKVTYKRNDHPDSEGATAVELELDAENPNEAGKPYIQKVVVDGIELSEPHGYRYDAENNKLILTVDLHSDEVEVEIDTYLEPQNNAKLEGLYQSDNCITTQCESEGFRRITPFLDRPDVMAVYTVRIEAAKDHCPVLMANGNQIDEGETADGRHFATYNDPWPKPCYLFCTANGKLEAIEDTYTTGSGREVAVRVFTEIGESEKGRHALDALKQSMQWDEDVFGCEYDLDNFNIVTVAKFSFGAMENKGLNVFRDSLILANPDIATDGNYQRITDVVGHEYFHNWSGNRVTLANWFNISLKEGLTVMREQMFTAFTTSDALERINAVSGLRTSQFPTDDSPLAHPVMPQEVESVENCYTSTIYEKGSEVIRMMKVMMGEETWIEGVKDYFAKNDGKAVTINEFVESMEQASGLDFSGQFHLWYTQSGRPRVAAEGEYDADAKTYTLTLKQKVPPTSDQPHKDPMVIPLITGLVDKKGNDLEVTIDGETKDEHTLILTEDEQVFIFENVEEEPAFHSLLRGFSAPVTLEPGLSEDQLYLQMVKDPDGFNRWDAGQKLGLAEMQRLYAAYEDTGNMPQVSQRYIDALGDILTSQTEDLALTDAMLTLPDIKELESTLENASPSAIAEIRTHLRKSIANGLETELEATFDVLDDGEEYSFDYESVGKRSLKNLCRGLLNIEANDDQKTDLRDSYFTANNMTDKVSIMASIRNHPGAQRDSVFNDFFREFEDDALTIQKWIMMQAATESDQVLGILDDVSNREFFDWENPGHVSSLVGGFIANYAQFHRPDGKGYEYVADMICKMDDINPKTASRFVNALSRWGSYSEDHQKLMIDALKKIAAKDDLSRDVSEKVFKSLPNDSQGPETSLNPTPSA